MSVKLESRGAARNGRGAPLVWLFLFFWLLPAQARAKEIRAQSGKHRHQGGVAIHILEGRGYTVADGDRYDWQKGDLLTLPVKPDGVVFQHFNASEKEPALLIAAEPNLVATTGVDRACGFEQLEEAPACIAK